MTQNYTEMMFKEMMFKKRVLLNLLDKLQKNNEVKFIEMWNEYVSDIYEDDRRIYHNDEDGVNECIYDFSAYNIVKMVANGKYNSEDTYVTRKDGNLHSFNNIVIYIDVNEMASYIVDKNEKHNFYFDVDAYLNKDYFSLNRDMIIQELILQFPNKFDFNQVHQYFVLNDIDSVGDIIDLDVTLAVDEITNPRTPLYTKQDIWKAMRYILINRNLNDEVWKNTLAFDLEYQTRLVYWGEEVDTKLIEITLRKDRNENDIIVLTSIATIDGEEVRDYDDVTHFSYAEMRVIYDMMLKNI